MAERLGGWSQLALNPTNNELFAAGSPNFVKQKGVAVGDETPDLASIQLWKLTDENVTNMSNKVGSNKRQKTEISTLEPSQLIQINGGVSTI